MNRILFMPLLQIPSGHHHVAECITEQLKEASDCIQCEKVELLSYCYGKAESLVSSTYLQWIHTFPHLYSRIYKSAAVQQAKSNKRFLTYEKLFLKKMLYLLHQKKPDIVVCTHALPSYLVNQLKSMGLWKGTVINVYTDYFINDLWGIQHIDYHFVPSFHIKQELRSKGVESNLIFVTGIPVHPIFKEPRHRLKEQVNYSILISGGNMGAGSIMKVLHQLNPLGKVVYRVLCGKNKKLYESVVRLKHPCIHAIPYISSKQDMNQLYNEADAIISKPGGVTITECLWKGLPVFVYDALPGQEEFNLHYLKQQGLIYHLEEWKTVTSLEKTIINTINQNLTTFLIKTDAFQKSIEKQGIPSIIQNLLH
ncbi:MGDG synthase family glycosyltransferase [Oceanobacillus polygoni]|uniref:UDP-N-acetylglucosamine:LPS N-acetylglucosamine transferase n=1 Tax=Oceanobacillus polygoni TaxID=1235259 RepID=A0A9X1CAQ9_9BACI|nr:glycosyltransferase [Oceanobacillus polygoni]MBP2076929.1 UDP-N-acetylglucosamine:LPS N-acetylglucosamine transferase [Oceanobacillus polygoni]